MKNTLCQNVPNLNADKKILPNFGSKPHLLRMDEVSPASFSPVRLRLTLFLCGLECLFFGATITGWASIVYIFKEDGVFSHLCNDENMTVVALGGNSSVGAVSNVSTILQSKYYPRCSSQDQMFSLIFTVALLLWGVIGIPVGWFFDKYGLLKTRLMAIISGLIGFLAVAWAGSDAYTCYILFPGTLFLVTCHMITVMTCTHMAILAGAHASTAVALFCGAGNSSIVIFLIVKILHDKGISRNITLTLVASIWILVLFYSILIMPRFRVVENKTDETDSYDLKEEKESDANDNESESKEITSISYQINDAFSRSFDSINSTASKQGIGELDKKHNKVLGVSEHIQSKGQTMKEDGISDKEEESKIPTLRECMKSAPFISNCVWFSLIYLAYFTFIGTYNPWVTQLTNDDNDQVNNLINILAYCQLSSILISLVPGTITDFCRSKIKDHDGVAQGVAAVPNFFLCTTVTILLHVCVLVDKVIAVYVSAIISEIARAFLFSTTLSFLSLTFPVEHYGLLFGISYFVAGVCNLFQYPLFIWADSTQSYFGMNLVLLSVCVLAYYHPIYLIITRIKASLNKTKESL